MGVVQPKPKLLDQVRDACRVRHYSLRIEVAYVQWNGRFILFHNKCLPNEMGSTEINAFLTHLAVDGCVAASTQNQAFAALLFLYRKVLGTHPGRVEGAIRAKRPTRIPVVLTRIEVRKVLEQLDGTFLLIAQLLYGSGMRLLEGLRLRVKEIDFDRNEIAVRQGKGDKDRRTMLPKSLKPQLLVHLDRVRILHEKDLAAGFGSVEMPSALARKLPGADRQWIWQYVFPSVCLSVDPRSAIKRRHHTHEGTLSREITNAVRRSGIQKTSNEPQLSTRFRYVPSGSRIRYPNCAGTVGTSRREYDDDLHTF